MSHGRVPPPVKHLAKLKVYDGGRDEAPDGKVHARGRKPVPRLTDPEIDALRKKAEGVGRESRGGPDSTKKFYLGKALAALGGLDKKSKDPAAEAARVVLGLAHEAHIYEDILHALLTTTPRKPHTPRNIG